MAQTRNLDEGLAHAGSMVASVALLAGCWRSFARAHGLKRPTPDEPAPLPDGLASALVLPLFAQGWAGAHAEAPCPSIRATHVEEERLAEALGSGEVNIRLAHDDDGAWVAECSQGERPIARVRFRVVTESIEQS